MKYSFSLHQQEGNLLTTMQAINIKEWSKSIYKPTPTIIDAAPALYKGYYVKIISRSDSSAINLTKTINCLNRIIEDAKV